MLTPGLHCKKNTINVNDKLLELKGFLNDEDAQRTFAQFLKSNPKFACELLFGIDIYPFQDLAIRSMFKRDFVLNIWSRGLSKCKVFNKRIMTNRGLIKMGDI